MKASAAYNIAPEFLSSLKRRRGQFLSALGDGIAVVGASRPRVGPEASRFAFRQNGNFYYLTGMAEPDAVAVFLPGHPTEKTVLFLHEKDRTSELWNGPMIGIEGAKSALAFDAAYPLSELEKKLREYLEHANEIYWSIEPGQPSYHLLHDVLMGSRLRRQGADVIDPFHIITELRLFKDEWEISQISRANEIAGRAHGAAMRRAGPGLFEYQVQSTLEAVMREEGAMELGYPSIVASGANACCLHYTLNSSPLERNELLLIDAGCEWNAYTADITRTFPVSGSFTAEQRAIYSIVLEAQKKAIAAIKPGVTLSRLNEFAMDAMTEGLIGEGILQGSKNEILEKKMVRDFYPHSLSHWLGIDVHDVGRYRIKNNERPLEPGMCFTVEPGLYIQNYHEQVAARWRGIGVRIEDNILVTTDGSRNFTKCAKEIDEVCDLVGGGKV